MTDPVYVRLRMLGEQLAAAALHAAQQPDLEPSDGSPEPAEPTAPDVIHVEPTPVTVDNHHHAGPVDVHVEPTPVHVAAPNVNVNVPRSETQTIEFERDELGRITSAVVKRQRG
jgi:hypothetical protein